MEWSGRDRVGEKRSRGREAVTREGVAGMKWSVGGHMGEEATILMLNGTEEEE